MNYVPLFSPAVATTTHLKGPHVDFAGLSPLIALLGGAVIVLLVGLRRLAVGARPGRAGAQPGGTRRRAGADDLAVERAEVDRLGCAADR